ncbi:MAG: hypothetical protein A2402_02165 [Candidatus Staskawiczbacteria bacterium RIFOXYC1_FULL_37_43]|nr:MAG: hypothetical protein A2813_02105 [Candidatus Staskawiczbacteria bacterium RIFCSPHIGHO2_01_FULL_37_17]OGZ71249.1 MAG: hypothetical protein A2891_03230 [Candidatus Staskawiczbacteria bacterium RIFCSPLOWO2_01_FULL_37_19]OGZ75611.1 MAG: hypothetical protein A2205_00245 [Candidatus Staskawiczbacteria bacterium RIFOXYA1_FULL_37_15]OGZ76612.1 MAG: hypothetical protein A2280_04020 [Candidatus Staskawiczbacteria bacterium RIFOXYA12_FULL_37_10]OGZ79887.1 MAG: hypothetical protein A2353_01485 [Can
MEIKQGALVALKIQGMISALGKVLLEQKIDDEKSFGPPFNPEERSFKVKLIYPHSLQYETVGVLAKDLVPIAQLDARQPVSTEITDCLPEIILGLTDRITRLERRLIAAAY